MVNFLQNHIGEATAVAALFALMLLARVSRRRRRPVIQSPVGAYRTYPTYDR